MRALLLSGAGRTLRRAPAPAGGGGVTIPSYVPSTVGAWAQLPGSAAMSAVAPSPVPPGNTGPSSKIVAWTSFAIDQRNSAIYSVANGGHADYSGNEANKFTVETETPAWSQVLAPTPTASIIDDADYYADGRPTSRHSYHAVFYQEATNQVMLFGGAKWSAVGNGTQAVDSYNTVTNTYSAAGTHPNQPTALSTSGDKPASALDPTTGDIYFFGEFLAYAWRRSSNTWQSLGTGISAFSTPAAFDTTRRRILMVGSNRNAHHHYNVDTNTLTSITLTGSQATAVASQSAGGMVYVAAIDKFLLRTDASGGTVYQIDPVTFDCSLFSTTGGASVPSTQNGPYNKFLYAPRMKSCLYFPEYGTNPWVLRVHA